MTEWWDGGMAEWQDGGMAEWRDGGMVFYYIPNLSCYIYGTHRQRHRQCRQHRWLSNHLDVQAERGFAAGAVLFDLGGNGAFWKKRV
jgi:hypothetical protein